MLYVCSILTGLTLRICVPVYKSVDELNCFANVAVNSFDVVSRLYFYSRKMNVYVSLTTC